MVKRQTPTPGGRRPTLRGVFTDELLAQPFSIEALHAVTDLSRGDTVLVVAHHDHPMGNGEDALLEVDDDGWRRAAAGEPLARRWLGAPFFVADT